MVDIFLVIDKDFVFNVYNHYLVFSISFYSLQFTDFTLELIDFQLSIFHSGLLKVLNAIQNVSVTNKNVTYQVFLYHVQIRLFLFGRRLF